MPAPLSADIRNRFQTLHLEGHSAREIGRRLLISTATAVRYAACLRKTGNITPAANPRRQGHGRLVPYEDFFADLVEQDPDITLKELQAALLETHGVQVSLSGIDVVLRRLDLTYKKIPHRGRTAQTPCKEGATSLVLLDTASHRASSTPCGFH